MSLTLLHQDIFNRADSDLSGSTMSDGLGAWTDHPVAAGKFQVTSNKATATAETVTVDSAMSAVDIQKAEVSLFDSDSGVIIRWAAGAGGMGNFYLAYDFNGNIYYYDGSFHSIASPGSWSPSSGDVITLEGNGTSLDLHLNGISKATATDATYATGICGMYGGGSHTTSLDNFKDYVDSGGGTVVPVFYAHLKMQGIA